MRYVRFFAPFVVIAIVVGQGPRLLAWIAGARYIPQNANLEGARILSFRQALDEGQFPPADVWLAGSSRTMADYRPQAIVDALAVRCAGSARAHIVNLGNVANSYVRFSRRLRTAPRPALLLLEFSPHMLVRKGSDDGVDPRPESILTYRGYRQRIAILELWMSGRLRQIAGLADPLVLRPETLGAAARQFARTPSRLQAVYYAWRSSSAGYGQVLGDSGQVPYRAYLPDRQAAENASGAMSELEEFRSNYLAGSFDEAGWNGLLEILRERSPAHLIVVVRPPIHRDLYEIENRMQGSAVKRTESYLAEHGIPYIDMNPNDFSSADRSHVDWFDTAAASRLLGERLAALPGAAAPCPAAVPGVSANR